MLLAREVTSKNPRRTRKGVIFKGYNYSLLIIRSPQKMENTIVSAWKQDLGVFIKNTKLLNIRTSNIVLNKTQAFRGTENANHILLIEDNFKGNYIKTLMEYAREITEFKYSFIMIPLNREWDVRHQIFCDKMVQELNSIIPQLTMNGNLTIYQKNEPISSIAYIVNLLNSTQNVSICLNLDFLKETGYSSKNVLNELKRYGVLNRVGMIKFDKGTKNNAFLKEVCDGISYNVIVFGDEI